MLHEVEVCVDRPGFEPQTLKILAPGKYLKSLDEKLDLATLCGLPEVPRDVEEGRLQEENEANPLVVLVVFDIFPVLQVSQRRDSGVRVVVALLSGPPGWHREGGVDPAVGVHDA